MCPPSPLPLRRSSKAHRTLSKAAYAGLLLALGSGLVLTRYGATLPRAQPAAAALAALGGLMLLPAPSGRRAKRRKADPPAAN